MANYCPICGMDLIKKEELEVRYVGPKGENYCYGSETHISDRKQEKRGGELNESIKPTDIHGYWAEHTAFVHDSAAAFRV